MSPCDRLAIRPHDGRGIPPGRARARPIPTSAGILVIGTLGIFLTVVDIRTKLALALVSVALFSMLLLGTFAYRLSTDLLQEISERQLDALVEAQTRDLEKVVDGWRDAVRLIRSRTQLRFDLKAYQDSNDEAALADMQRIVADAQASTSSVQRITLFDRKGNELVAAGAVSRGAVPAQSTDPAAVDYSGFYLGPDERPMLIFHSLMTLDSEVLGSIEVVIDADSIEALARNYRGLGETGETMVFGHDLSGSLVLMHSLRHTDEPVPWFSPPEYVQAAVTGVARMFTSGVHDYREEEVLAATRFIPDVNWGVVVKLDAEEENRRPELLRRNLVDLSLALGAFAVVGGTLLGFYLARPIRELAQIVDRVRHGETDLRADASADDEIGLLAETLNEYFDQVAGKRRHTPDDDRMV